MQSARDTRAPDDSPRIGHIHVTVDDAPWHWADASGEALIIVGLPVGPPKVSIEVVDANHEMLDSAVVDFVVPNRFSRPKKKSKATIGSPPLVCFSGPGGTTANSGQGSRR
ncbi:DUF6130 family protein [Caballeronia arationis]|uniref:DUF6130 family protein n=1 Tax=Caballeronia arationis TaxID=1777142 RepID=UPI003CC5C60B